jgi:PKD repeat protein
MLNGVVFRVVFDTPSNLHDVSFPVAGSVSGMTGTGHVTLPAVIGVGSIFYVDIDSGGQFPPDTQHINSESASSMGGINGIGQGGAPFYFDTKGNLLPNAPQLRNCPDISAPDGSHTSFFGTPYTVTLGGQAYDSTNYPSFFGTSASAGVAAAVGALILERCPLTTPAQMKAALQATALDIVATQPPSGVGPDAYTGAGLIQALAATNGLPAVTSQPGDVTVDAPQSATFSVTATGSPTLQYQWQKNFGLAGAENLMDGTDAAGATVSGSATPTLQLSNINGGYNATTYRCVVSNAYGTVASHVAKLTVPSPPVITSGPIATPNPAAVGQAVTFSASATGGSGTLQYAWNFGDGSPTAFGSTVIYAYAATGLYTATVTVTDPVLGSSSGTVQVSVTVCTGTSMALVGSGPDSDCDGFSDAFETALGFDPTNPTSNPLGRPITTADIHSLTLSKSSVKLNFKAAARDSIQFSGSLPIPAAFNSLNSKVYFDVGGVAKVLTLTAKGSAKTANDSVKLSIKTKKKVVLAQTAKYSVSFKNGTFATLFAASGLTNANVKTAIPVNLTYTFIFDATIYQKVQTMHYTAKKGKFGAAK